MFKAGGGEEDDDGEEEEEEEDDDDGEEDEVFNDEWAQSGGMDAKEMNKLEMKLASVHIMMQFLLYLHLVRSSWIVVEVLNTKSFVRVQILLVIWYVQIAKVFKFAFSFLS